MCPPSVSFFSVQAGLVEPLLLLPTPLRKKGGPSMCDIRWALKLWENMRNNGKNEILRLSGSVSRI